MQDPEQVPRQARRAGAAGDGDAHARARQGGQHGGHVVVEGEGLAEAVRGGGGLAAAAGLQRRRDVGVDPEGPEGVVEVEDDERGERRGG